MNVLVCQKEVMSINILKHFSRVFIAFLKDFLSHKFRIKILKSCKKLAGRKSGSKIGFEVLWAE